MSIRRCVTVLAIAMLGALCAAPTAGAKTKTVVAGGPPPTANLAGSARFPTELDLNGFFRRQITINVGDSVRWTFSHRVVHTVTFLPPGQSRPSLEVPDPADPYTGFNDAAGVPFWFNGQPSLLIRPTTPSRRAELDQREAIQELRPLGPRVSSVQADVHEDGDLPLPLPRASGDARQREGAPEGSRRSFRPRRRRGPNGRVHGGHQAGKAARQVHAGGERRGRGARQRHGVLVPVLPPQPDRRRGPVGWLARSRRSPRSTRSRSARARPTSTPSRRISSWRSRSRPGRHGSSSVR